MHNGLDVAVQGILIHHVATIPLAIKVKINYLHAIFFKAHYCATWHNSIHLQYGPIDQIVFVHLELDSLYLSMLFLFSMKQVVL